jgi:hypothetical protein
MFVQNIFNNNFDLSRARFFSYRFDEAPAPQVFVSLLYAGFVLARFISTTLLTSFAQNSISTNLVSSKGT